MPTILGANTLSGGYDVANSLRMNAGDNSYLSRTKGTSTSTKIGTYSFWFKLSTDAGGVNFLNGGTSTSDYAIAYITSSETLKIFAKISNSTVLDLETDREFRDVAAWYHCVIAIDTTQGTSSNRVKIYINGTQETGFSSSTYPGQNDDLRFFTSSEAEVIGRDQTNGESTVNGYLAEFVKIDGTQLTPTSFGEFDEDTPTAWKPIDVSGLTFGTNGFYLEFKQSGTSANSSGLGADTSGNDNHFGVTNLVATDQSTDTCTNNFTTLNPRDVVILSTIGTFSEGNLQIVSGGGSSSSNGYSFYLGSIGLSNGKWYWEVKCTDTGAASLIGIVDGLLTSKADSLDDATYGYSYRHNNGNLYNNNSNASYGNSYSTSDIIGVYLDLDNNKLYFGKNGVVQNSGTGKDITAAASTRTGFYFPTVGDTDYSDTSTWQFNFGAGSPISVSSGNADPNGYGNFEYDPSSGTFDSASKSFYAINTKNLAEFG